MAHSSASERGSSSSNDQRIVAGLATARYDAGRRIVFLDCVRGDTQPRTDGRFGVAVVKVMEAIEASLAARGAPTPVNVLISPADAVLTVAELRAVGV